MAALRGLIGPHQRRLLAAQLRHVDFLDAEIADLSAEITERMRPFEPAIALADTIPGVGRRTAEVLLAETGVDMSRFPSDRHLASWARMCPGMDESAGKRGSGATGRGNRWLRSALVEAAHSAARTKNTYLAAQYRRLAGRRGAKRAAVAVGCFATASSTRISGQLGSTSGTAASPCAAPSAGWRRWATTSASSLLPEPDPFSG